ncbi:hypothetical protein MYAER_0496 [Microcystis aeruginosa NIES-2549]|uniref:Uncharacterized protein n=2 Tax=Microcystis TaxID=1125 RepID=A0A0F6U135_MICAE|nr:hypothetical protein [Microcystis aeruginosa]AKE62856.1 hypothetical protein MYAER_0496 [Microcystis aeruginosa NIES-2549]
MSSAITEAITTIALDETRFNLSLTEDGAFFPEWKSDLLALSSHEKKSLDELIQKYLYQRSAGQLLEETVTLLLVSPLLAIAGFYDPPLRVRAEESVSLTVDDGEEILSGRIDVLVWLNQFWVVIVESKKTALSVWTALPQTLAYLMANPRTEKPGFALVTNGDDILLVKLRANAHHYALSRVFAPFISREELYRVLQIFKHIGAAIK